MSTPGAPPRPTPPQHPTAPIHPHPRSAALNPAHLHAPLPTHPEFQHDPHLPDNIAAARRLRITLSPLLSDPVPPLAEPQPPSPVSPVSPVAPAPVSPTDEKRGEEGVLHPVRFRKLPLVGKTRLSHDTARYRLGLPRPTDSLGLPVGQHVSLAAQIGGKRVIRSYTPTSLDSELGYFDLVVKTYSNGLMSSYLDHLPIGAQIEVRGPKGAFAYSPALAPYMLLVAGGSGITPMYRIIKSAALDPTDTTRMALLWANVAEEDILLRKELEFLASKSNGRLTIHYILEHPPKDWTGSVGYVTPDHLRERLPPAPHDGKVLLCGPPGMTKAVKNALKGMGYEIPRRPSKLDDDIFVF